MSLLYTIFSILSRVVLLHIVLRISHKNTKDITFQQIKTFNFGYFTTCFFAFQLNFGQIDL